MGPFAGNAAIRSLESLNDTYEYIVVGGGNAGCVLARRLSDKGHTVLVVEKGDSGDSVLHRTPLPSFHHFSDGRHSTVFESEPDRQLQRPVTLIAGRGLGGTTRINGGHFTLGVPAEYNSWAQSGYDAWSYDEFKPYLTKAETWIGAVPREFHGTNGPVQVRSSEGYVYGCNEKMAQAAERLGFPSIGDMHSPLEPAFGYNKMQFTVGSDGTRQSSFRAYLPPAVLQARADKLHICTNAIGAKLCLSHVDNGRARAETLLVQSVNGKKSRTVTAIKEIVLAAGALVTPQLLLLSGIGPCADLGDMGIEPLVDLPGVGAHLQDHIFVPTTYNCPLYDSLWAAIIRPHILVREIYRYAVKGAGWLLMTMVETELFGISSLVAQDGTPVPHSKEREDGFNPENLPDFAVLSSGLGDPSGDGVDRWKGFYGLNCGLLKTKSCGRVSLRSADPLDAPKVETNYLSHPDDWVALRAALRVSLALAHSMRVDGYWLQDVRVPDATSDATLDAFIRAHAVSMYHYSSSCRMASREGEAPGVVDARLRVYGVDGLRVADASVIPNTPAAHPQAMVYAVAEKCADMMLEDAV